MWGGGVPLSALRPTLLFPVRSLSQRGTASQLATLHTEIEKYSQISWSERHIHYDRIKAERPRLPSWDMASNRDRAYLYLLCVHKAWSACAADHGAIPRK